tara:strand:- start:274 stop:990 length:717 start_codon:yes stop_codon:yes gene_type:complete
MHPGEAFHGDLCMIASDDVFIAISNSGETDEVLKLLPFLRDNGNFIIAITGNPQSTLAKNSHCHLNIAVSQEACPLQLAPTSSTTATLVMGDALTLALMEARNFKPENFARFHPRGSLGRRLLGKVSDDMLPIGKLIISADSLLPEVIQAISEGGLGLALSLSNGIAKTIITDGDLRIAIEKYGKDVFDLKADNICSSNPLVISSDTSIQVTYDFMDDNGVNALIVTEHGIAIGILEK